MKADKKKKKMGMTVFSYGYKGGVNFRMDKMPEEFIEVCRDLGLTTDPMPVFKSARKALKESEMKRLWAVLNPNIERMKGKVTYPQIHFIFKKTVNTLTVGYRFDNEKEWKDIEKIEKLLRYPFTASAPVL